MSIEMAPDLSDDEVLMKHAACSAALCRVDAPPIGWWLLAEECRRADKLKRAKEQVMVEHD